MASEEFISIKDLATRLGMDRSHARRYVLKLGYVFHKRRTPDSGSQLTLCVSTPEADEIVSRRKDEGFIGSAPVAASDVGVFYVIQLVPDLDPKRLKLGFAQNEKQRLSDLRTAAPTARLVKAWPCKRHWELTAIDALTGVGCRLILNEVFECDDPNALVLRGDSFFGTLPHPTFRCPRAKYSVLKSRGREAQDTEEPAAIEAQRRGPSALGRQGPSLKKT